MSNDWFRSWHGAPTDNKWLVIARKAGTVPGVVSAIVWALLDHASQEADRGSINGFDVETYAAFSGFEEGQVQAVIDALRDKDIIGPGGGFKNWSKRQPKREDNSTERVKAHRERTKDKQSENERAETQCNAAKREETIEKIREEKISSVADATARPGPAQPVDEIWTEYPRVLSDLSGKSEQAVRKWIGKVLSQHNPEATLAAIKAAVAAKSGDPFAYATRVLTSGPGPGRQRPGERKSAAATFLDIARQADTEIRSPSHERAFDGEIFAPGSGLSATRYPHLTVIERPGADAGEPSAEDHPGQFRTFG